MFSALIAGEPDSKTCESILQIISKGVELGLHSVRITCNKLEKSKPKYSFSHVYFSSAKEFEDSMKSHRCDSDKDGHIFCLGFILKDCHPYKEAEKMTMFFERAIGKDILSSLGEIEFIGSGNFREGESSYVEH